jgi:hypothetical protein
MVFWKNENHPNMHIKKVIGQGRNLEIVSNSRYRKYKGSTGRACLANPISQHRLDISPIWMPHITNEVAISMRITV